MTRFLFFLSCIRLKVKVCEMCFLLSFSYPTQNLNTARDQTGSGHGFYWHECLTLASFWETVGGTSCWSMSLCCSCQWPPLLLYSDCSFWEVGEPNNHIDEDCGYIVKTRVESRVAIRSWYDAPCSMDCRFICEREMGASNSTALPHWGANSAICDDARTRGWTPSRPLEDGDRTAYCVETSVDKQHNQMITVRKNVTQKETSVNLLCDINRHIKRAGMSKFIYECL